MRANYMEYRSPQFHLLSDRQLEELHLATLQILERTGVAFECQEAIDLLGEAGADISNPNRVKIPSCLVEKALQTAPKMVTIYSREGQPAMVLNGTSGPHFRGLCDSPEFLDPYTGQRRACYIEDIADTARVADALPNIEWLMIGGAHTTVPGTIADKVSLLQVIKSSSKPVAVATVGVASLREMLKVCSVIVGGEKELQAKPFLLGSSQPISPLLQGKDLMEKSLLCAEKGVPILVYGMQMAGATAPATFPGCLVVADAEILSQLVVLQLKNPGTPVIIGSMPNIMDMKTTIYPYGAPELSLSVAALTELSHYYKLPMLGSAGYTDSDVIGAQAGAELTYQIIVCALSGADLAHDVGVMYHARMISPEFMVLADEVIDMVKVLMRGIEINDETLPLGLIERVGPKGTYISEKHTLQHFREFWMPKIFDRSATKGKEVKNCEELLRERTIKILRTHKPKPLSEDLVRELGKMEKGWFEGVGLEHLYPKRTGAK